MTWNANTNGVPANGSDRQLGEVVRLDLWADDGSIAYFDTSTADGEVCAITVDTNYAGGSSHPVSGIRCWGYQQVVEHDKDYYIFYTTGIDACNRLVICGVGAEAQQATWQSLMQDIGWFVNDLGGVSYEIGYMNQNQDVMRSQKRNGETIAPYPSTATYWSLYRGN